MEVISETEQLLDRGSSLSEKNTFERYCRKLARAC
jgi:hypothetical protein